MDGNRCIFCGVIVFSSLIYGTLTRDSCVTKENTIDCSNKGLAEIPNYIHNSETITELDLSQNSIKTVSFVNTSHPLSVLKISFSYNKIDTFVRGVLDPFENLKMLDLSHNQITGSSLHIQTFKYEIGHFKHLHTLILRGNHLGTLERLTFTAYSFPTLEYLDLSHCSLSTLEHLSIDNIYRLKYLDLSYNNLRVFDALSLEGLSELEILILSYNKLTTLREIPMSVALKKLYIDHNSLVSIKENIMKMAFSLEIFSLKGNKLKTLPPHVLPFDTESLSEIQLDDNPWHCDCNIKWLVEQKNQLKFTNFSLRCKFPAKMRNKDIFDISEKDLVCLSVHSHVIFALLILLSTCLVVSAVGLAFYHNRNVFSCIFKSKSYGAVTYSKVDCQRTKEDNRDSSTVSTNEDDSLVENEFSIAVDKVQASDG